VPDRFGFDHLSNTLRCVECGQRWQLWELPVEAREAHRLAHREPQPAEAPARSSRTERRHQSKRYLEAHRERRCAYELCDNRFVPLRSTRRFCSEACRQRAHRHGKRANEQTPRGGLIP
jgi:hypothetical protein